MDDEKPGAQKLLAKALRGATLGAVSLLLQAMAPAPGTPIQPILDRARSRADERGDVAPEVEQLVMQQGGALFVIGGHRSHASHSSHRSHSSHVSGGGGSYYVPAPSYAPKTPTYVPPEPEPQPQPTEVAKPAPAPKKATLRVKATPRARVFVNGKEVGLSPTAAIEVTPGPVEIRLVHKLLGEKTKHIVLKAGASEELNIDW